MKTWRETQHVPSTLTPLDYAYRLLARRAYSEQALAEKMLAKGFSEGTVQRTVNRLQEQGYLHDTRVATDLVEQYRTRGFGPEAIKSKLLQKGVSLETIEQVLSDTDAEEIEDARQLLASRFSADALKDFRAYARAYRLLIRRGYSQNVVETLLGGPPEPDM
ncbi:MAG: regulatory protein RecX [Candidatus Binatia bacterium]